MVVAPSLVLLVRGFGLCRCGCLCIACGLWMFVAQLRWFRAGPFCLSQYLWDGFCCCVDGCCEFTVVARACHCVCFACCSFNVGADVCCMFVRVVSAWLRFACHCVCLRCAVVLRMVFAHRFAWVARGVLCCGVVIGCVWLLCWECVLQHCLRGLWSALCVSICLFDLPLRRGFAFVICICVCVVCACLFVCQCVFWFMVSSLVRICVLQIWVCVLCAFGLSMYLFVLSCCRRLTLVCCTGVRATCAWLSVCQRVCLNCRVAVGLYMSVATLHVLLVRGFLFGCVLICFVLLLFVLYVVVLRLLVWFAHGFRCADVSV